ncbi:MAG: hypothetical protein K9I94_04925 [Bacteroidales bacterium]|nr:hypothetical protein [Bacteroidales bacterium]
MKIDLKPNEVVVKAGDTNRLVNKEEQIKGKLILTNQRLYFKSSDQEPKDHDLELMPGELKEIMYFKTGLFASNGLNLITSHGNELKFKMKKRDSWGERLVKMC